MFLSHLNNISESDVRAGTKTHIFSQFKISCQKIEILAQLVDLFLIVAASALGGIVCRHSWFETPAIAQACLSAGILNGTLCIYVASKHGLYRFAVLLAPLPCFGRLLASFAFPALLVTGSLFILKGTSNIRPGPWLRFSRFK